MSQAAICLTLILGFFFFSHVNTPHQEIMLFLFQLWFDDAVNLFGGSHCCGKAATAMC